MGVPFLWAPFVFGRGGEGHVERTIIAKLGWVGI